ncbi:hypothetical protein F5J12DRAFT_780637 [Pisolithus orientalis]|uniref:uncharacterized protein n=1 Tax=Pisolithus orientalis TaxID=936130 RepID=UPI0022243170|nr:uncharacterized protein F5J12DRAFT_780637 [Pisolithus orientalis]KAI6025853.1 hypothetical protein F5J12DRAFT_780637 [Pisolithus orientalis]
MTANSIPSIRISPETDGYQLPSLHYPSSNSETTNMRTVATPSISQSSKAFDPHPYNALALDDFIITEMYDQLQKDDCDYPSSPFLPDDGIHRHTSTESVATRDLILPPRVPGHHRSHSAPSISRGRIATQAMLDANARRRVHDAQFTCGECHQTFTAQFSLKRHQRSHTGERLFQCSIPGCGQKFYNSSDCKRHEKSKKRLAVVASNSSTWPAAEIRNRHPSHECVTWSDSGSNERHTAKQWTTSVSYQT